MLAVLLHCEIFLCYFLLTVDLIVLEKLEVKDALTFRALRVPGVRVRLGIRHQFKHSTIVVTMTCFSLLPLLCLLI